MRWGHLLLNLNMLKIPKKRLISVALDWGRKQDPLFSLAQSSMIASLQRSEVPHIARAWQVNSPDFKISEVVDFIMSNATPNTDLGLGTYVWHDPQTELLLTTLKQNKFPGRIILGGPQVSYVKTPGLVEKYFPQADIFIRGYAENALAELLLHPEDKPSIKGVHYAHESDLGLSATAELGTLPSPFLTGIVKPQSFIRIETTRGCPFSCSFCQHRESDEFKKRRQFELSRTLQEIEWITSNPIIQSVAIIDPTFNSGPHYLTVLQKFIDGKYTGKLSLQCRIEMITPEFLEKVLELNKTARVVLEFGLQTIHPLEQKTIERPTNLSRVSKLLREVITKGIECEVSLIFGLPFQTVESFQKSVDFCIDHGVPTIHAFPLMLLRGTRLEEQRSKLGLVESMENASSAIDRVQLNIPHVVAHPPHFTYQDWRKMAEISASLETRNQSQKQTALCTKNSIENNAATLFHQKNNPLPTHPAQSNPLVKIKSKT